LAEQQKDAAAVRRARQTLINLLLALGVTLGVLLTFMMIVPRDDSNMIRAVDYTAIAADVKASVGVEVIAPETIPAGWWSNSARWRDTTADGVNYWHVGFVGPNNQYVGIDQAIETNQTWLAQKVIEFEQVSSSSPTGEYTLTEFQGGTDGKTGEKLWIYTTNKNADAILIGGTAKREEFAQFFKLINLPFND
jgi:hypothetical protein